MKAYRTAIAAAVCTFVITAATWWGTSHSSTDAPVMSLGVSADGEYVLTAHRDNTLILWNIGDRSHRIISESANIYSAEFNTGGNVLLWQDLDHTVHMETIEGEERARFEAPPVYSHSASRNLGTYLLSDREWALWMRNGDQGIEQIKAASGSFAGLGKVLNVELASSGRRAVTAGFGAYYHRNGLTPEDEGASRYKRFDGVAVWDLANARPTHNLGGNAAKTHANLSPDGEIVVAVDENGKAFVWDTTTGSGERLSIPGHGVYRKAEGERIGYSDKSGAHLEPSADFPDDLVAPGPRFSAQFLSEERFLTLYSDQPYAALYKRGDPFARAILDLGTDPAPSVYRYDRNAAIDSAPRAGVLVTGQRDGGGINVYDFDAESRSLERVWAPTP